jgi:hypothetical protein
MTNLEIILSILVWGLLVACVMLYTRKKTIKVQDEALREMYTLNASLRDAYTKSIDERANLLVELEKFSNDFKTLTDAYRNLLQQYKDHLKYYEQ